MKGILKLFELALVFLAASLAAGYIKQNIVGSSDPAMLVYPLTMVAAALGWLVAMLVSGGGHKLGVMFVGTLILAGFAGWILSQVYPTLFEVKGIAELLTSLLNLIPQVHVKLGLIEFKDVIVVLFSVGCYAIAKNAYDRTS